MVDRSVCLSFLQAGRGARDTRAYAAKKHFPQRTWKEALVPGLRAYVGTKLCCHDGESRSSYYLGVVAFANSVPAAFVLQPAADRNGASPLAVRDAGKWCSMPEPAPPSARSRGGYWTPLRRLGLGLCGPCGTGGDGGRSVTGGSALTCTTCLTSVPA